MRYFVADKSDESISNKREFKTANVCSGQLLGSPGEKQLLPYDYT